MKPKLISIGELVHASIPKTGLAMKELHKAGPKAYTKASPQLDYIVNLIKTQVKEGADYVAVNVDEFGEDDSAVSINLMEKYVQLIKQHSNGRPVCIDSGDDDVLIAGLKQWYKDNPDAKVPLVNSIKVHTMEKMYPYKQDYKYKFIALLLDEKPGNNQNPVEHMYDMAKIIFNRAMDLDFEPGDIFFDSTVFPLAIDMPMNPGQSSYCYNAFETIKKIKADPEMKGVHFSLGVSNSVRDLPGRKIGVCRAYVELAIRAGLDAAIVNPLHHYGEKAADPELIKLVQAFANLNGDMDKLTEAMDLMGKFCRDNNPNRIKT